MLNEKNIAKVITKLNQNEIIILPTDTIYGFSSLMTEENARKINQTKKAPAEKPLIALFKDLNEIEKHGELTEETRRLLLAETPTTVIIPALNKQKTLGVRLVKRQDLKEIINKVGPLWSTSVNYHGDPNLNDLQAIEKKFPKINIFIDEKINNNSRPSRIFDQINNRWIRK